MTAWHRSGTRPDVEGIGGSGRRARRALAPLGAVAAGLVAAGAGHGPLLAAAAPTALLVPGTIVTYAGGGSDDGQPAVDVPLWPGQIALDASGALYIAEAYSPPGGAVNGVGNRVRRVKDGIVTTVAGTGDVGFSGDGGPARAAQINEPGGVVADADGSVYISDTGNDRVRRVDPSGTITTVVSGLKTPAGLALDRSGNLYIAESGANEVVKVPKSGGTPAVVAGGGVGGSSSLTGNTVLDGVPATESTLSIPNGVVLDSADNIYIADTGDNLIRRVDTSGTITTIYPVTSGDAGPAMTSPDTTRLSYPYAVAVDVHDTVYTADAGSGHVITVNGGRVVAAVKDPDPADTFHPVVGIAVDRHGMLYYAPSLFHAVFDMTGAVVAGNATTGHVRDGVARTAAILDHPQAVATDATGSALITDAHRVWRVVNGGLVSVAGSGLSPTGGAALGYGWNVTPTSSPGRSGSVEGWPAQAVRLSPTFAQLGPGGQLYVGDYNLHEVLRIDGQGILHVVAGNGYGVGVASAGHPPSPADNGAPPTSAGLLTPEGIAFRGGALFFSDSQEGVVWMVRGGAITIVAGANGQAVSQCTVESSYGLGAGDDGGPATKACLSDPMGLALDRSGNLYIADAGNNRVRKVDEQGTITTVAGNGVPGFAGDGLAATQASLHTPTAVAVDRDGQIFIADSGNRVVRKVDIAGVISTVAGSALAEEEGTENVGPINAEGQTVPSPVAPSGRGDGGPATGAYLQSVTSVALDAQGNLLIADPGDNRVREVLTAASGDPAASAMTPVSAVPEGDSPADRLAEDRHMLSPHPTSFARPVPAARTAPPRRLAVTSGVRRLAAA